jgi:hypothetical protein
MFNLVLFKTLVFHGDILKDIYKKKIYSHFYGSSFIPNFTSQKKKKKIDKISFSQRKMLLKSLSIAQLINNFTSHYTNYLNLKYIYEKWYLSPKKPLKFQSHFTQNLFRYNQSCNAMYFTSIFFFFKKKKKKKMSIFKY